MRTQEAIQQLEQARIVRREIGIRATMYNDPALATTIARSYAANPHLNPEILLSLALGGANEQQIFEAGKVAQQKMIRDGIDISQIPTQSPFPRTNQMYDGEVVNSDVLANVWKNVTGAVGAAAGAAETAARAVAGVARAAGEAVGGAITDLPVVGDPAGAAGRFGAAAVSNMANYSYASLKGYTRNAVMLGESGKQFVNAIVGQMAQEGESPFALSGPSWLADIENDVQGNRFPIIESGRQVGRALGVTDVGVNVTNPTAFTRQGEGFLPSDEFRNIQGQAQQDLLGETTGRYGQPEIYTVGRAFADALSDTSIIRRDSAMFNVVSGAVDGTITVVADPWNAIGGGAMWGAKAIKGLPNVRNATKYNDLAWLARYSDEKGNPEVATMLMREALESIGINEKTTSPSAIRKMFNSTNETDVAIRATLMDEAGMIREGDNLTIMLPEYAKFLTQGTGRKLIDALVDIDNPRLIRQMFSGNIGHKTAVLIADTKNPKTIAQLMARAVTNPAEDILNYATKVPHIGVFHMAERGLTIKRSVGSHTRLGNYLPETAIISPDDPVQAVRIMEQLASVLPMAYGTGRLGKQVGAALPSKSGWRLLPDFPALQRARQDLPKTSRYAVEEVDELINRVMRAYASDNPGNIKRSIAEFENTLERMFESLGYTLGQAQDLAPWHQSTRQLREFLTKDIANGVPEQAGPGPALWAQLISQPITLIDPSELPNVLRRSGRAREILRHVSPYAENQRQMYEVIGKMEDAITEGKMELAQKLASRASQLQSKGNFLREGDDALKWINVAQDSMDTFRYYWKASTLMRFAYPLRVTPEESARILAGGVFENPIDYVATIFNGRYKSSATDTRFVKSTQKTQQLEIELDDLLTQRDVLKRGGRKDLAAKLDKQIDNLQNQIQDEFEIWNTNKEFHHKALVGRDPAKNIETLTRERMRKLGSSGQIEVVNKNNPQQLDQWTDGLISRLSFMNTDIPSVAVAQVMRGKKLRGNVARTFEVDGVKANVAKHLAEGRFQSLEEAMAHYFVLGPGRKQWYTYASSLAADGKKIDPNSLQDAQSWVSVNIVDEINYLTGGVRPPAGVVFDETAIPTGTAVNFGNNMELLEIIAAGTFEGKRLTAVERTKSGAMFRKNPRALEHVRKFAETENSPAQMFAETGTINGISKTNMFEEFAGWFFSGLYGIPSDILARSPAWKRIYWTQMADLVRTANQEASEEIVKNARKAVLPSRLMKKIEDNAGVRLADASTEELDRFASISATNEVKELLYDSSRRGATADSLRFFVAFGDAWKEVYKTWAKLFVQKKGKPAVRLSQGVYAGERLELGGPGDIYGYDPITGKYSSARDGSPEGFFWKDETTGERKFTLPLSGQIISKFAGILGVDVDPQALALDAPVRNLNIAGAIFPGFMPVADQLVAGLLPEDPSWNGVRNFIFPFGEPLDPETRAGQEGALQRLVVPAWLRRTSAIFGLGDSPQILQYLGNLLNNADSDVGFQNTRNHAMKLLNSEGGYDPSAAGFAKLEADADRLARIVVFMRGIAQFVGPAAPGVRYNPSVGELLENDEFVRTGNISGVLLAQEMNEQIRTAIDEGRPISDVYTDVLDKYGPNVWMQFSANTESKLPGAEASKEWFEWSQTNQETLDTFPLVGAFFGPTGEYDFNARSSLMARGVFEQKPARKLRDDAAEALAYTAYSRFRDELPPESARTKEQRDLLFGYRRELEGYWGITMFSQQATERRNQQVAQLQDIVDRAIAGEPVATRLTQTDTGKYLVNYMAARESAQFYASRNLALSGTGWRTSVRAAGIRDGLRELGNAYAAQDAGFNRMWQFILEREMVDAEQDVMLVQEPSIVESRR